jgi:hypothetical protein
MEIWGHASEIGGSLGVCPKCCAALEPSGVHSSASGPPLSEHVTCRSCGANLSRNRGGLWRQEAQGEPGSNPPEAQPLAESA